MGSPPELGIPLFRWAELWTCRLFRAAGFDKSLQVGQVGLPEGAIAADPGIDGLKGNGIETVVAVAARATLLDKPRATKHAKMLGDGRTGNGEAAGDPAGGQGFAAEEVQNGAASGVGERGKYRFAGVGNRSVTHNT